MRRVSYTTGAMSEWGEEERESAPTNWAAIKKNTMIGAVCVGVVIAWMMFARPGEEATTSRGFNLGSDGGSLSGASGRPFAERPKTSLDMVSSVIGDGPPGVDPGIYRQGPPVATAAAVGRQAVPESPAPAPAPTSAAAPAGTAAAAALSPADDAAAGRLGVPKNPKDLAQLGMDAGIFKSLFTNLAGHPRIVGYLLNNRYVVDGYMSRESSKRVFGSPDGMKQYLSDTANPHGVSQSLPLFMAFLKANPDLAGVVANSALAAKIYDTPGFKGFVNDPAGSMAANPAILGLLTNPQVISGLGSNSQSAQALKTAGLGP